MNENKPKKQPFDALAKLAVIGDTSVGKTNILLRFVSADYHMSHISTIGIDFKVKTIQLDNFKLKLQIWDTAGQQRYRNLTGTVYQGANGILLAYSITDRKTFQNIEKWMSDVKNHAPDNTVVAIVANKLDLQADRVVTKEEGEAIAAKYNAIFMETSAKQNTNIQKLFLAVANRIKLNMVGQRKSTSVINDRSTSKKDVQQFETPQKQIVKNQVVKLKKEKIEKDKKKGCC